MTLDDLRKIAEQATEGPWEWERPSEDDFPLHDQSLVTTWKEEDGEPATVLHGWGYDASGTEAEPQDRLFIATFNPQKVLELLDQIEQLSADVESAEMKADHYSEEIVASHEDRDKALTRLAAVEKLHRKVFHTCHECGTNWPCETIKVVRGE